MTNSELKIEKIYLSHEWSIERENNQEQDSIDGQTDVVIFCENGDTYAAAFVTLEYIKRCMENFQLEGSFIQGRYFWVKNMLVIGKCERSEVELVVDDLLEEGNFFTVFEKL